MKYVALIVGFCSLTLFASERPIKINNASRNVALTVYYKNGLGFKDHTKINKNTTFSHNTTSESVVLSWYNAQFQQKMPTDSENTHILIQDAIAIKLGAQPPIYRLLHPEYELKQRHQDLKKSSSSSSSSVASSSETSSED